MVMERLVMMNLWKLWWDEITTYIDTRKKHILNLRLHNRIVEAFLVIEFIQKIMKMWGGTSQYKNFLQYVARTWLKLDFILPTPPKPSYICFSLVVNWYSLQEFTRLVIHNSWWSRIKNEAEVLDCWCIHRETFQWQSSSRHSSRGGSFWWTEAVNSKRNEHLRDMLHNKI